METVMGEVEKWEIPTIHDDCFLKSAMRLAHRNSGTSNLKLQLNRGSDSVLDLKITSSLEQLA